MSTRIRRFLNSFCCLESRPTQKGFQVYQRGHDDEPAGGETMMKLERAGHNPGAGKQQQLSGQREVSVTWL